MDMEIWDLYDEQGRKTGETWERSRAMEIPEGRYHIVCDILIRHKDGEFLLSRQGNAGGDGTDSRQTGADRNNPETAEPFRDLCVPGCCVL